MKGQLYQRGAVPMAVLLVAVLGLTAALPAEAEGPGRRPVTVQAVDLATVQVFPGGIDLAPKVRYERALVTVTGMGRAFTLHFDSHTRPSIGPFDAEGELLGDGVYRWELELVPDEATARGLRESASNNGGVAQRPWLPKSGSFAIQGGIVANPDAVEGGASSRRAERATAGRRADVPAQQYAGQVLGAEKASRGDAVDTDEVVAGGFGEAGLLKAGGATPRARAARTDFRTSQTGLDSDHQAGEIGVSAEQPLVMIPKAHEMNQPTPRPRSDGANGRPRSDR